MVNKISHKGGVLVNLCVLEVLLFMFEKSYNILFDHFQLNFPLLSYPIYALIAVKNALLCFVMLLAFSQKKGWFCTIVYIVLMWGCVYYTSIKFPFNMEYVTPLYFYFFALVVLSKLIQTDYVRFESMIDLSIKVSRILAPLIILSRIIFPNGMSYMAFSDAISLPCALLVANGYNGKRIDMYLGIISIVSVFMFGGRGSLLSLLLLFGLLILFNRTEGKKVNPIYIILIVSAPVLFELLQLFIDFSGSRTMQLFVSGEIGYDSSRSIIYEYLIQSLERDPISGIGMRGDRALLEGLNLGESNVAYAHNVFLEILLTFGMLIGSIIILFLMYLFIWKLLLKQMDCKIKGLLLSLFTVSFLQLMTSRTFLTETNFYILIFILVNISFYNYKITQNKKNLL